MLKEKYEAVKIEIITFPAEDIIRTSGNNDNVGHAGDTVLPVIRFY